MATRFALQLAANVVAAGGIVAYPTEGVYGLGCNPFDGDAVARLLQVKHRSPARGLILIGSDYRQLEPWLGPLTAQHRQTLVSPTATPQTWVAPACKYAPYWITGDHDTIAVRLTTHPLARALCAGCGHALVSTSANRAGHPPARSPLAVRKSLGYDIDYVLNGAVGELDGPTPIRNLVTGERYR